LLVLVIAAGLASLAIGSRALSPATVVDVLFDNDGSEAATIVHALRVPRTVLALSCGAALGIAGALTQGHTRNPLADPGVDESGHPRDSRTGRRAVGNDS
jgi:iron complex transport system permease protein